MESTSVALDREAYHLLKSHKRPGESFSAVVKRLAGRRQPLASFAGAWKDMPAQQFRAVGKNRRRMRAMDQERLERLWAGRK